MNNCSGGQPSPKIFQASRIHGLLTAWLSLLLHCQFNNILEKGKLEDMAWPEEFSKATDQADLRCSEKKSFHG
jgi:hypothetical protein